MSSSEVAFEVETISDISNEGYLGSTLGYYTRGHVDGMLFAECVKKEYPLATMSAPSHRYWRCVPTRLGTHRLIESQPGRGVFPVTVVEIDPVKPAVISDFSDQSLTSSPATGADNKGLNER